MSWKLFILRVHPLSNTLKTVRTYQAHRGQDCFSEKVKQFTPLTKAHPLCYTDSIHGN